MSFLILVTLISIASAARIRDLPSYFPKCNINDPKINECLLKATEEVKPFLSKGVPELGAPALARFLIEQVNLEQRSQSISFDALLKNVVITGLDSYKFTQFDFDIPNLKWTVKADLQNITLIGDYKVNGTLIGTPIHGNGKLFSNVQNVHIEGIHQVKISPKNGQNYTTPIATQIGLKVKGPVIHLDGLFDGDENLNKLTNNVIRDNIDMLFEDMRPLIELVMSNIFEQYMINLIEDRIPFNRLYKTSE